MAPNQCKQIMCAHWKAPAGDEKWGKLHKSSGPAVSLVHMGLTLLKPAGGGVFCWSTRTNTGKLIMAPHHMGDQAIEYEGA